MSGAVGGAVLGGLLLGPFGAIFGANLGSEWGAKRAPRTEEEEMDEDIVQLARSTGRELADAMESKARALKSRDKKWIHGSKFEESIWPTAFDVELDTWTHPRHGEFAFFQGVLEAKDTLAAKIIRLEDEIQDLTKRAEAALEAEDEATARAFLEKRWDVFPILKVCL